MFRMFEVTLELRAGIPSQAFNELYKIMKMLSTVAIIEHALQVHKFYFRFTYILQ